MDLSFYAPFPPCSFLFVIMKENKKEAQQWLLNSQKQMNFASFPDVEKTVEFPEEKKKAETATTKEAKKVK